MRVQPNPGEMGLVEKTEIPAQTKILSGLLTETIYDAYEEHFRTINTNLTRGGEDPVRDQLHERNVEALYTRVGSAMLIGQTALSEKEFSNIHNLEQWLLILEHLDYGDHADLESVAIQRISHICRENPKLRNNLYKQGFQNSYRNILGQAISTHFIGSNEKPDNLIFTSVDPYELVQLCEQCDLLSDRGNLMIAANLIRQVKIVFRDSPELHIHEMRLNRFICSLISKAQSGLIEMPNPTDIMQLATLIREDLLNGRATRVLSPLCPDYATEIDPITGKHRFTMKGVGGGLGLVGGTVLNVGAPILHGLNQVNSVHWRPGYAGLEGTETNLIANKVLGGTHKERMYNFMQLLRSSAQRFQEATLALYGQNIQVGIYPEDALFSSEERQITLEDFDLLRQKFRKLGSFSIVRKGMGDMQNTSTGIDWIIMGLIASSRRSIIVDGASSLMGKKFYLIARELSKALGQIALRGSTELTEADVKQVASVLGIDRSQYDPADVADLVSTIRGIIGDNIGAPIPVIYIKANYAGY